jgi:hypothetical protein
LMIDLPTTRYSGRASKKIQGEVLRRRGRKQGIHHRGAEGTKVGII